MIDKYILRGHEPIPCEDLLEWGEWIGTHRAESRVAVTELPDGTRVSTVFLGLDHSFGGRRPMLFETCIFLPATRYLPMFNRFVHESDITDRYSTWAEAEIGHMETVEKLCTPSGSDSQSS